MKEDASLRLREVDAFLAHTSWDQTWGRMNELIEDVITSRRAAKTPVQPALAASAARAGAATAVAPASFITGD
jgi:hypothetical protein